MDSADDALLPFQQDADTIKHDTFGVRTIKALSRYTADTGYDDRGESAATVCPESDLQSLQSKLYAIFSKSATPGTSSPDEKEVPPIPCGKRRVPRDISKFWVTILKGTFLSSLMQRVGATPIATKSGVATSTATNVANSSLASTISYPASLGKTTWSHFLDELETQLQNLLLAALAFAVPAGLISATLIVCSFCCYLHSRWSIAAFMTVAGAVYIYIHQDFDLASYPPGLLFG
jgi:hypothetical protein